MTRRSLQGRALVSRERLSAWVLSAVFGLLFLGAVQALAGLPTLLGVGSPPVAVATCCILDGITTGIKVAYSTRKLLTAYAGSAIRVENTTTTLQQDIGFVSNTLDTTSLATFCVAATCVVVTWYDQSGNGQNVTQGTLAQSPTIYQSGSVNTLNSKPALLFVGASNQNLSNGNSNNPVNTQWQNAVVSLSTAAFGAITGGNSGTFEWRVDQTTGDMEILNANTLSIGTSTSGLSSGVGAVVENQYNSSTGVWSFWLNRAAVGTGTQTTTFGTAVPFNIGSKDGSSESANGSIGEVIIYDLVGGIPGASQTAIENNQKAFWGTP